MFQTGEKNSVRSAVPDFWCGFVLSENKLNVLIEKMFGMLYTTLVTERGIRQIFMVSYGHSEFGMGEYRIYYEFTRSVYDK